LREEIFPDFRYRAGSKTCQVSGEAMQSRLTQLSAGIDRTAAMGPFPHDQSSTPLSKKSNDELMKIADSSEDTTARDQALWQMIYKETQESRSKQLPELLYSVATSAKEAVLRRSGSWGLMKLGEVKLLMECLRADDDGNTHSWKQHLIYESQGRTDWVDPRPVRALESRSGFAVTLPLTIHGMVQFREFKPGFKSSSEYMGISGQDQRAAPYDSSYSVGGQTTRSDSGAYPSDSYSNTASAPPSYGAADPRAYDWHSMVAGPIAQRRLVGGLTAAVGLGSFYDNLIIQKVCTNPLDNGFDHVQGYLFRGMSRSIGGNAMAHYYTSRGTQPLYLSGRIGDASEGVIEVETQLSRHAETNIVTNRNVPYPFVQSVRGLFYGPARMNTVVLRDENAPIDNLLQIVKEPYSNGWFFGEFRSVLVDADGDGQVEVNGMEMYTDLQGNVLNRTPPGPQRSLAFAR
jgi:hypothetical protein